MEPIFSMTTLQRNPNQVKAAAKDSVVRITEQGTGAYVFCSEEAFERRIQMERSEAMFEARLSESIGRGLADIESGFYTTSIEGAFMRAEELRNRSVVGRA